MYHNITLVGNLGRDPEMRYTPDGKPVTRFSVASKQTYTDRSGQRQNETTWFDVTTWAQAETCNQYLHKGDMVHIEGRLIPDKNSGSPKVWQANDGTHKASYEVRAIDVQFLRTKQPEANSAPPTTEEIPF